MKNLKDINKFVLVKPGDALSLVDGEFPREVRLEVNAEEAVRLAVRTASAPDDLRFITDVRGRDTVVFTIEEPCELWPSSDGQVWWWTVELEAAAVISDAPTYTKIAERRARNPELERVARKMEENAQRRMAALLREMDARYGAKTKEDKADEPAPVVSGNGGGKSKKKGGDTPPEPVQEDGGGADEQREGA